jgi:hypothetical protein
MSSLFNDVKISVSGRICQVTRDKVLVTFCEDDALLFPLSIQFPLSKLFRHFFKNLLLTGGKEL